MQGGEEGCVGAVAEVAGCLAEEFEVKGCGVLEDVVED